MSRPTTPLPTAPPQPSPLRSSTAPTKKHHHHHHVPHVPHHRHRHHHRDKSVPQSAILPSSTSSAFDSLLSPLTKATSRTEGAPDLSTLLQQERESRARERAQAKAKEDAKKKGWEEVRRARERRRIGEEFVLPPLPFPNAQISRPASASYDLLPITKAKPTIQTSPYYASHALHPRCKHHPPPRLHILLAPLRPLDPLDHPRLPVFPLIKHFLPSEFFPRSSLGPRSRSQFPDQYPCA